MACNFCIENKQLKFHGYLCTKLRGWEGEPCDCRLYEGRVKLAARLTMQRVSA